MSIQEMDNYQLFINKFKRFCINPKSKKELINLLLKNFYTVDEKSIRLKIISEITAYLKKLRQTDAVFDIDILDEDAKKIFFQLEQKIRESYTNDMTVNYMIIGFFTALDTVESFMVRKCIYHYLSELTLQLHKLTAMNYTNGAGCGLVLYTASLTMPKVNPTPHAIFYFGA